MKSCLVAGILGTIMVAVCAMPYRSSELPPNPDDFFEWPFGTNPQRPIPNVRVEREIGFAGEENAPVSYGLNTFLNPESDRKGGEARGEAREYQFAEGSPAWKDLIV